MGTSFECTKLTYIRAPVGSGALKFKARIAAFVGTNYNKHGVVHCHHINFTTWDFYGELHGKMHGLGKLQGASVKNQSRRNTKM